MSHSHPGNKGNYNLYRENNGSRTIGRRLYEQRKEFQALLREQEAIISAGYDGRVLKRAMKAFSSLHTIYIRRSVGELDSMHRRMVSSERAESWDYVSCCWVPACKRAIETVLEALDYGKPPIEVIKCPGLSTQSFLEMPFRLQNRGLSDVCRLCLGCLLQKGQHLAPCSSKFFLRRHDSKGSISAFQQVIHQAFPLRPYSMACAGGIFIFLR
jgi:hypothetical protein